MSSRRKSEVAETAAGSAIATVFGSRDGGEGGVASGSSPSSSSRMPAASILGLNHKLWIQWRGHSGSRHELRCNGKFGGCKAEELALSAVELGIFVGLRHDLERNKQEVAREKMVAGLGLCQTLGPTPCGERGGGPCFQQSGLPRSED